jgi:xanthine dehydrogenase accessory factor
MRDVLDDLARWWNAGETVGMATVIATWRSAPRPAGATMLVGADGTAVGSVSGGCVEGAVYELATSVVATGAPVLQRYGVSDDDAFAVGLTCGGILDVYVEKISPETFPEFAVVVDAIRSSTPVAVVTCVAATKAGAVVAAGAPLIDGTTPTDDAVTGDPADRLGRRLIIFEDHVEGTLGNARIDDAVADDARGMLATGKTGTLKYGYDGERRGDELTLFVASYHAQPRMIVFGAIDFAAAVARMGAFLGYRVTVCDARPVFATKRRFPDAHEVIVAWPHRYLQAEADAGRLDERTVVCVLTHDPKFDAPVLEVALRLPLAYVGAMGSRRTHDDRLDRLREAGLSEDELSRLASPVGLDLGARTPEETAVSIAAEVISARWGGSGERLTVREGRIHHEV